MSNKLIKFNDRHEEMIAKLRDEFGYPSFSSVVHQAVVDMYKKNFPSYMMDKRVEEKPEDRMKRRADEKKAKEDIAKAELTKIAAELGGAITTESGKDFCVYFTYTNKKRFEQKVPLTLLSTDLVKTQYFPSKEAVLKLQKEKKVDYDIPSKK